MALLWDSPPQAFQTHQSRQAPWASRELLLGAPSSFAMICVCSRSESNIVQPSLENAFFFMDFHMNEAQAKFEAVSCPELPLAAWISHLDKTTHSQWDYGGSKLKDILWQSQRATPKHSGTRRWKCSCHLMPSRSSDSSKSFGQACIFFRHLLLSLPQIHLRFLQPCHDYSGMNTMTAVRVIASTPSAWQASKKVSDKTMRKT